MPTYAVNRKVTYDYEILEKLEAGVVLSGAEVKAVRNGQINLKGSYVTFLRTEAYLLNAHISPYKFASPKAAYDPTHSRKLLLSQKEIAYLRGKSEEAGLTIVPLSVYTKSRFIKIEIAVARGKKKYDKREAIKKRDVQKDMRRALRG